MIKGKPILPVAPDAIYNEMSARAAETPRSARPAAAAAQRLRFPGDRNEPAAVLRARGKCPAGRGRLRACPPRPRALPGPGQSWGQLGTGDLLPEPVAPLPACLFALESSCWVYGKARGALNPFRWNDLYPFYLLSSLQMI